MLGLGLTELTHMATGELLVPGPVSGHGGRSQARFFCALALLRFRGRVGVSGVSTLGSLVAVTCLRVSPGHHEDGCALKCPQLQHLPSSW